MNHYRRYVGPCKSYRAATREEIAAADIQSLDVSNPKGVEAAAKASSRALGKLDILVCSAGISGATVSENYPIDSWRRVIDVNLNGLF